MGWRVGGFSEVRELGTGAQGRVVLARHDESGEIVAIKYLAPGRLTDERALEQFRHEARTLVQVANVHVARLRGLVEAPGGAAIVMEAVNGVSLRKVLDRYRGMSPESALVVLKGSLQGLAAAHAAGVVHRDYKPANVMVQADGLSKLIDFGIAGLAGQGSRSGTPAYMAPEQWEGGAASPATDVYAATCVFFECVTGHRPYTAGEQMALMRQHLMDPVPAEAAPGPLRPLLVRGMAKEPGERPPGAEDFVAELEAVAGTTYGPDWEARGWAALGVATAAVAMLFPLAALGLTAAGAGAVGVGTAAGQAPAQIAVAKATIGKGLLATTTAKVTATVATTAVVAAAGTGTYVVVAEDRPKRPAAQLLNVSTGLLNSTSALPNGRPALQVQGARYVQVTGFRDRALQQKVNRALRAPLDDRITRFRGYIVGSHPQPSLVPKCARVTGQAAVRLGGPRLISVRYLLDASTCTVADEDPAARFTVNVDLRTGSALRPADVFTASTLTPTGFRRLADRLPKSTPDLQECGYRSPLRREALEPSGGFSPAAELSFTGSVMEFNFAAGLPCPEGTILTLPYSKVTDLMKPQMVALLPGAPPTPTRS